MSGCVVHKGDSFSKLRFEVSRAGGGQAGEAESAQLLTAKQDDSGRVSAVWQQFMDKVRGKIKAVDTGRRGKLRVKT